MRNVAVIPCRGGSKGIPKKNLQQVHGIPLVIRAINSSLNGGMDEVYVSTDDETIASYAIAAGAKVLIRPTEISQDTSSTDEVLQHTLEALLELGYKLEDNLFLQQATTPFTQSSTIKHGIEILKKNPNHGVFTVTDWHGFIWNLQNEIVTPHHHNHLQRQRRQDLSCQVLETGGLYGGSFASFKKTQIRFVDPLIPIIVDRKEAIEIDTWDDLVFCNNIEDYSNQSPQKNVKVIFSDFDGVLTDNRVFQLLDGEFGALINRSDGVAINTFKLHGISTIIITGESTGPAFSRANKLKVECIYAENKLLQIIKYCREKSIELSEVAYIGNDINDLGPIASCGWSFVPQDAHASVAKYAKRLLQAKGGQGVLREVADILKF